MNISSLYPYSTARRSCLVKRFFKIVSPQNLFHQHNHTVPNAPVVQKRLQGLFTVRLRWFSPENCRSQLGHMAKQMNSMNGSRPYLVGLA